MLKIRATSLSYVRARVSARASGAAVNPTSDTVAVAFETTDAAPAAAAASWKSATWDTDTSTTPTTYRAQCLVGPSGTVNLSAGTYYMFVKVTDSPEVPIMYSGIVQVVA